MSKTTFTPARRWGATLGILLLLATITPAAQAQETVPPPEPRPSPTAIVRTALTNGAYVKLTYSQPHMRERAIFGELVPFGKVWRLGANEATELTTTGDLLLGGETLKAGTYTLFAIPHADHWTLIVDGTLNQWGQFGYDQATDVMRLDLPVETLDDQRYEAFTIMLEETDTGAMLSFMWDQTRVSVPVQPAE